MESVSATGFISEEAVKFLASYYEERKIFFRTKVQKHHFCFTVTGRAA
jgi:hypothetical protein